MPYTLVLSYVENRRVVPPAWLRRRAGLVGVAAIVVAFCPDHGPKGAPYLARFSRDVGDADLYVPCQESGKTSGGATWSPTSREKRARYGAPFGPWSGEIPKHQTLKRVSPACLDSTQFQRSDLGGILLFKHQVFCHGDTGIIEPTRQAAATATIRTIAMQLST